jgi:hypothetical protein
MRERSVLFSSHICLSGASDVRIFALRGDNR